MAQVVYSTFVGVAKELRSAVLNVALQTFRHLAISIKDVVGAVISLLPVVWSVVNGITQTVKAVVGSIRGIIQEAKQGIQMVRDHLSRAVDALAGAVIRAVLSAVGGPGLVMKAARFFGRAVAFVESGGLAIMRGILVVSGAAAAASVVSRIGELVTQVATFRQRTAGRVLRRQEQLLEQFGFGLEPSTTGFGLSSSTPGGLRPNLLAGLLGP